MSAHRAWLDELLREQFAAPVPDWPVDDELTCARRRRELVEALDGVDVVDELAVPLALVEEVM